MVTIIVPLLAVVMATGGLAALSAFHEANEIYDAQLSHLAKILLAIEVEAPRRSPATDEAPHVELIQRDQKYEKKIAFRVWKGEQLLHRSQSASEFGPRFNTDGLSNRYINGDEWRVFVLSNTKEDLVVEVAERLSIRAEMTWFIVGAVALPLLLMLPLITFFAWRGIYRGLRPLSELSAEVRQRSPNDLKMIATANQPDEMLPMLDSINGLMGQLGSALETERRFTDYAAHELRTPLAAIKTLFQASRKSSNPQEQAHLTVKLEQAITRATHLVSQLLTLARVSHADLEIQPTDIVALTRDCVEDLQSHITEKELVIRWHADTAIHVATHASLLQTLIHNIVLNAVNYTPARGVIDITCHHERGTASLTICDSGPGIPVTERDRVFDSFYRGEDAHISGAGLGLSIVRNIAHKLNLKVMLTTPDAGRGLAVSVTFPHQG
jgi:two-component system sensor histidine kinase QseC